MQVVQAKNGSGISPIEELIENAGKILDYTRNFAAIFHLGKLKYVNPVGLEMLGYENATALFGMPFDSLLHPTYKEIASLDMGMLVDEDKLLVKLSSETINSVDVHLWVTKMVDIDSETYLLEAREITKHLRSAADLQVREQHLNQILSAVPDCILSIDENRRILSANPATITEFGLKRGSIRYSDIANLVPHMADMKLSSLTDSSWDRSYQKDKYWFGLRDGETFPIELVVRPIREGDETHYTCIIRNVEERVQAEEELHRHLQDLEHNQQVLEGQASEAVYLAEELEIQKRASEHLALHDPLTDLPNRRYFQDFLKESLKTAEEEDASVCLLFIDLDHFKEVNDTLGHDAGDNLLLEVSSHLKKNTRGRDMVARLGGDEFAVVLNSRQKIDEKTYSQIAARIIEDLHISVKNGASIIQASASIGAAIYPADADTVDSLIKTADTTMYEAKRNGRNQVVFAG